MILTLSVFFNLLVVGAALILVVLCVSGEVGGEYMLL